MRIFNATRHFTLLLLILFSLSSCGSIWSEKLLGPLRKKENPPALVAEPLTQKDTEDMHVVMLEEEVVRLQSELNEIRPAVIRLKALEGALEELLLSLKTLNHATPSATTMAQKIPENAENAPQPLLKAHAHQKEQPAEKENSVMKPIIDDIQKSTAPAKAAVPTGPLALKMRIGEYANKMRLVIEAQGVPGFDYDIDNTENLFTIAFADDVQFDKKFNTWNFKGSMIETVSKADGDQPLLIFALNRSTRVLKTGKILPNKDNPNTRIFFDLEK